MSVVKRVSHVWFALLVLWIVTAGDPTANPLPLVVFGASGVAYVAWLYYSVRS